MQNDEQPSVDEAAAAGAAQGTMGTTGNGRDGVRIRRRSLALIAVGAVALTGAGFGASLLIKSPAQAAADSRPPAPSVITIPVEYRALASSLVLRGTVVAGQSVEITPGGGSADGGSPTVSKLPLKAGDEVRAGRLLIEISGRPVIALQGTVPLYRDLKPGAQGSDVGQLQDALQRLGHPTSPDNRGRFGEGTKAAVTKLYEAAGYEPVPVGGAEGSAAVTAAEAQVTSSERALDDAKDALKSAESGSGSGSSSGSGSGSRSGTGSTTGTSGKADGGARDLAPLRKSVARAREDLDTAREALVAAKAASGPMVPSGEVTFLESFPARVQDLPVRLGGKVQGAVMTVAAGPLVVHAYVPDHQKGLIRADQKAELLSEADGATAEASVQSIATARTTPRTDAGPQDGQPAAGQAGGQADADGYLMVVTPGRPLEAQWTGQNVRLTVLAATTGGKVLVVPVSAVSSGADGATVVTVLEDDGKQRRVRVKPGTTGDGHVEVTPLDGEALREGARVVTGVRTGDAAPGGAG
ncbi:peptidoglycan-binding protein [Streptomyces sp. ZAF1911]|uniref:peptidoglycan-binding protein n=1 Tax=Streptomyces sp. ZAF1911 TaxID=2944129 RepID=UPI00237C1BEF|nr:peptidoglycan-binding protein [Streptomyces sp. ZAF1911]MDD9378886.1 peptidoglycan-binding protein [Streptomyces sp. ZAF1911]